MLTASPQDWAALAAHLHLTPYEPTASYTFGASFRQIKHALGARASGAPSFAHWLHGERRGAEVVFLTFSMSTVTLPLPGQPGVPNAVPLLYTAAIARIDPPLFLGLSVGPSTTFLYRDLFAAKPMKTGHADVDRELAIVSAKEAEARRFLSLEDPEGAALLATMHRARGKGDGLLVSDSLVLCPKQGIIIDPAFGETLLDGAIDLAAACSRRRRAVPHDAHVVHESWARFASTHGFAFDDARLVLDGAIDGSAVEIAIENEGRSMRTSVTVRFPSPIGVAFSATRTNEGFLHGLLHRDIKVGHAKFDDLFTVTGHPEADVKAIFAHPGLADVLTRIGSRCTEVQMTPREIHFRLPDVCSSVEQLHEIAVMAHVATTALFGRAAGSVGAYR